MIVDTKASHDCVLVLYDIRSVFNVGSLFRTADGAGVSRVVLTGYTPGPVDRFGRARKDFTKVSLGAEQSVPWSEGSDVMAALRALKAQGYMIAAIEQDVRSVSLYDWKPAVHEKVAVVLGNEVHGLPREVLDFADVILEIPMRGHKESLNVSVAGGIALYHIV